MLDLIVMSDLPDNLFDEIHQWYLTQNDRDTISERAVLAYIRHNYTNYDELRKQRKLDTPECTALRNEVNRQINKSLERWIDMNKNPFAPAQLVQKKLKVLVYGESGTGKTWFSLGFPGRIAVIDTEGGTELYGGRQDVQAFDVLRTKSYEDVMAALDYIEADKGKTYQTVVIDPITVVWQVLQESAVVRNERKGQDGALTFRDWGVIKNKINRLYVRLTNMPIHVVVTSRLKEEYATKGNDMVKVGVKPDSERSTQYLFDIVLRLTRTKDGKHQAIVEKDRSSTLPPTVDNINYSYLAPIALAHNTGQEVEHVTDAEVAEEEADHFDEEQQPVNTPHWTETQNWKTFWTYTKNNLRLTDDEVHEALEVEHVKEFAGSKDEAFTLLKNYAIAKQDAAKEEDEDLEQIPFVELDQYADSTSFVDAIKGS
jgi:phage nucleotide-binding protein